MRDMAQQAAVDRSENGRAAIQGECFLARILVEIAAPCRSHENRSLRYGARCANQASGYDGGGANIRELVC